MSGVIPTLRQGPASYQFLNNSGSITGGQLVVPDASNAGGIVTAGAFATNVLGVSGLDAQLRTNQDGQNPAVLSQQSPWVPVYYNVEIPVTYAGAASFGQLLVAAASGQVAAYTPADPGSAAVTTPGVPATTVGLQNTTGYNVTVVITGGTMTNVSINGVTQGTGAGTYFLPAGATITLTYSVAPTWAWSAQPSSFDQIVGRCTEPLGIASGGTVGRARIGVLG